MHSCVPECVAGRYNSKFLGYPSLNMLVVLSPSKTLDPEACADAEICTQPDYLKESRQLVRCLRELSPDDIAELMRVSMKIANLNFDRYHRWKTPFTSDNARPAALTFKGDVYTGLGAGDFTRQDLNFAQKHLRILSGLYGLLRPLDLIQPYRLEMGTRLGTSRGDNLYQFWGNRITEGLREALSGQKGPVLVNLASQEYFKAVRPEGLDVPVITPVFKERKGRQYRVIGLFAKKARGMMTRHIIKKRLTKVDAIAGFTDGGYRYSPEMSTETEWVFAR